MLLGQQPLISTPGKKPNVFACQWVTSVFSCTKAVFFHFKYSCVKRDYQQVLFNLIIFFFLGKKLNL